MSKRKAPPLPRKPKFAMTGLAVGAGAGLVAGFIAEMAWHHSMLVMQVGGVVGFTIGAMGESLRFLWRRHRYQKLHASIHRSETDRR
jgi:hypothetical protein